MQGERMGRKDECPRMKNNDFFADVMYPVVMNWAWAGKEWRFFSCTCRREPRSLPDNESQWLSGRGHGCVARRMNGRTDGWIERMEEERLGEGVGKEAHHWFPVGFAPLLRLCCHVSEICKTLTAHSPAAAATTFIHKVKLSLNYSLCLSTAWPLPPVHPAERERERMTGKGREKDKET